jgi:hypothetical protein
VAEQVGPNMIEVSRLSSVRHNHVRIELRLYQFRHARALRG